MAISKSYYLVQTPELDFLAQTQPELDYLDIKELYDKQYEVKDLIVNYIKDNREILDKSTGEKARAFIKSLLGRYEYLGREADRLRILYEISLQEKKQGRRGDSLARLV